jgi:hypothetical protein
MLFSNFAPEPIYRINKTINVSKKLRESSAFLVKMG